MSTGPSATAAPAIEPAAPDRPAPRVCAVVIMNHPFPEQLPLLRRIYADRFSTLRFLIPFERLPDEDVITVYRGSYAHSGYITDARRELAAIDCDYYMVLHDDVLLNPQIDEARFASVFPLAPDEGFIPGIGAVPYEPGDWSWYFGMLPKLLYPKSQIFGAGIERDNLFKYLPPADRVLEKIRAGNMYHALHAGLSGEGMGDVSRTPTRALLQGLGGALRQGDPAQHALDARCLDLARALTRIMYDYEALYRPERTHADSKAIDLPLPLLSAGFGTDFYILPKSSFETFAHHIGVSSAANLFVEIMTPTLLVDACARVRVADDFGIDATGFTTGHNFAWFANPRAFAIHPFKLSRIATPAHEEAFIEQLHAMRSGDPAATAQIAARYFGTPHALIHPGWYPPEQWGSWAQGGETIAPIALDTPGPVEIGFLAPVGPAVPAITLTVEHEGAAPQTIVFDAERYACALRLDHVVPDADGIARIRLATDRTVCPMRLDPANGDPRELGIGVTYLRRG